MRIIDGFKLRTLGRDYIVVGEGIKQVNFNKMISLNETAAYLWKELAGKDFEVDDMVRLILDKYEVTEDVARDDCEKLAIAWKEAQLVK